jgi:hypothetical protein
MNRASVRRRDTLSSIMSEFVPPGCRARTDKQVRCSCRVSHLSDPVFQDSRSIVKMKEHADGLAEPVELVYELLSVWQKLD